MGIGVFFRKNTAYFIPVICFLLTGIVFLVLFDKDQIHIAQNHWYHPYVDPIFVYASLLGDGVLYGTAALVLVFVKWRYLFGLVTAALLTLFLVGFFKQIVYQGEPRPVKYFESKYELRLVQGVKMHTINSFPSGHTTSAFACLGFLALVLVRPWAKFLCFVGAGLVGYSRIYLSQHFLEDVVAGAFLGTLIAITSYFIMLRLRGEHWDSRLKLKKQG